MLSAQNRHRCSGSSPFCTNSIVCLLPMSFLRTDTKPGTILVRYSSTYPLVFGSCSSMALSTLAALLPSRIRRSPGSREPTLRIACGLSR